MTPRNSEQKLAVLKDRKVLALSILEEGLDLIVLHFDNQLSDAQYDALWNVTIQVSRSRAKNNLGRCKYLYDKQEPGAREKRNWTLLGSKINIDWDMGNHSWEEEFRDTVLHELAHHMCGVLHGLSRDIKGHGIEWKQCAEFLGCRPQSIQHRR